MSTDTAKPASWRDVYEAVNDTRKEVTDRIDALSEKVDTTLSGHEHRLTVVEEHQAHHAVALTSISARVDGHSTEISALRDQQKTDEAVTLAIQSARANRTTWRHWAIGAAIFVAGAVPGYIALFHH